MRINIRVTKKVQHVKFYCKSQLKTNGIKAKINKNSFRRDNSFILLAKLRSWVLNLILNIDMVKLINLFDMIYHLFTN